MKFKIILFLLFIYTPISFAAGRYYYEGDGCLKLRWDKSKRTYTGCYRNENGSYDSDELKKLNRFFNVPANLGEDFSLRTISWLDYIEDQYSKDHLLTINSAYRSPEYNQKLKDKGGTVGKTSYHMDAMALDVNFHVKKPKQLKEKIKKMNYGGVGYYHGSSLHIDSGKPRFWVTETAIEPDNIPPLNKNIYLSVDKDVYLTGEEIQMFFSGVSDYPIGIHTTMEMEDANKKIQDIKPAFLNADSSDCLVLKDRNQVRKISWNIPENFSTKNQKLHFKVSFCEPIYSDPKYDGQPLTIDSREFEVR